MKDDLADCIVYASKITKLVFIKCCYVSLLVSEEADIKFSCYIIKTNSNKREYKTAKELLNSLIRLYDEFLKKSNVEYGYA